MVFDLDVSSSLTQHVDGQTLTHTTSPPVWDAFDPQMEDLRVGHRSRAYIDELKVYDRLFDARELCLEVIGGAWCGNCCAMP